MSHILALDQGTTSCRAIIFDKEANEVASAQREFEQLYPKPGWVEHDPTEIWTTQASVITEALGKAHERARSIDALGVTNQRETTVVWDRKTGQPIYNAIVWQDRRTSGICDRLKADGLEETFQQKTGLVVDAYFSGTKVKWILDNVEGARERAEKGELAFGTIDSWLMYKLSSRELHITDVTNACRTLLFNIHTLDWDDELLEILGVPRSMMPEVRASSEVYGEVTTSLAAKGVPMAGIAGDQQAATFGQMCAEPGLAKNTYGTGCFLLMNTGEKPQESKNRMLTTVAWKDHKGVTNYALEGAVFIGGAIVQWLRDGLELFRSSADIEALAKSVPDSGGVVLVPALVGLGAPHWDQYARGAMVGLTRGVTKAHIARAALEGIAYEVADVARAMQQDAGDSIKELRADGGAAANDLLLQFQADILQMPVVRPTVIETTALGAAYLAGLATGVYSGYDEIRELWKADKTFEPQISQAESRALTDRWLDAVERSKAWEKPDA
jgi:glycerol kinase